MATLDVGLARTVTGRVLDPEVPVLTIDDLGILREVTIDVDGTVIVTITPTYSGCPAMGVIGTDVRAALAEAGFDRVDIRTVLSPAWTTDWMSESGKQKLRAYGIAPPHVRGTGPVSLALSVRCPIMGA